MSDSFLTQFYNYLLQDINLLSGLEIVAVVLAIAYLILAIRENIWCWVCGFASTLIYLVIFWKVSLLSESLLQVFYLYMSAYGWLQWSKINIQDDGDKATFKSITQWSTSKHLWIISFTFVVAMLLGLMMAETTSASFPYLDAVTSMFAIVATYMVAKKVIENWIYWIVIDSVSIYLYLNKGLYLTSLLFAFYVALCFVGYYSWRKHLQQQLPLREATI